MGGAQHLRPSQHCLKSWSCFVEAFTFSEILTFVRYLFSPTKQYTTFTFLLGRNYKYTHT